MVASFRTIWLKYGTSHFLAEVQHLHCKGTRVYGKQFVKGEFTEVAVDGAGVDERRF